MSSVPLGDGSVTDIQRNFQGNQIGEYGHAAGTAGTETLNMGKKILSIMAHSTTGGSVDITRLSDSHAFPTIPIPANVGFSYAPCGNLKDVQIVFTGTDMYLVEYAT